MQNISCKFCPYGIPGDIVCMNCAAGFSVEEPPTWNFSLARTNPEKARTLPSRTDLIAKSFPLRLVFQLETIQDGATTRWKIDRDVIVTGLMVQLVEKPNELGPDFCVTEYRTSELNCPCCGERRLKHQLANPDFCPQCRRKGLTRHVFM